MSTQREQMATLVADVVAEHFQRLRADLMEQMLGLRAPNFQLTPMGELYCNGERVGDVRPLFQRVVADALSKAGHVKPDHEGDDADDC